MQTQNSENKLVTETKLFPPHMLQTRFDTLNEGVIYKGEPRDLPAHYHDYVTKRRGRSHVCQISLSHVFNVFYSVNPAGIARQNVTECVQHVSSTSFFEIV